MTEDDEIIEIDFIAIKIRKITVAVITSVTVKHIHTCNWLFFVIRRITLTVAEYLVLIAKDIVANIELEWIVALKYQGSVKLAS